MASHNIYLLQAIYAAATDHAIITTDADGIITTWNVGAEQTLGYRRNEIVGCSADIIFSPEDREQGVPGKEFRTALEAGRAIDERWHLRKDGSRFWGEGVMTPIHRGTGNHVGFLKIMRDYSARKRLEAALHQQANFDMLTGIANRQYFRIRLREMMAAMARSEQQLILQIIDLDFFKEVNDSLGHTTGDEILRQTAQRMMHLLRETDFIARVGGDEFVVVQPNARTPEAGVQLAAKLLDALSRPFPLKGSEVRIGASIGMAVYPQDAADPDQLFEKADIALYRIKRQGRGGFSYFTERMDVEARERTRDLMALRGAIANREFWLAYQPIVSCSTGEIISLEVLLRCSNPLLRHHPIDKLINLAIEAGLMPSLGAWQLTQVCEQQRIWREAGLPPMRVSVNLCPQELTSRMLIEQIHACIEQSSLRPGGLEIEVTERDALEPLGRAAEMLEEVRALGVSIALDDFGSGYSSLHNLRRLPVDRVKLDQEVLQGIPSDRVNRIIVESVINMSHALGLEVIAEGVETPEQVDFLKQNKCDAMQGFLLHSPLPGAAITRLLLS